MLLGRSLLCLLAAALILSGCGSSDGSSGSGDAAGRPAPPRSDFPSGQGHTLAEVLETATPSKLVVSPAAAAFFTGPNRVPFGVFRVDGTQAPDAEVALYFTKAPKNVKRAKALATPAAGPFPARIESIATESAFRSQTTSSEAGAATAVYVTHFDFSSDGEWRVAALIREGDKLTGTLLPSIEVGKANLVPQVGDKAPMIHTPTAADVGGDLSKITTRIPPDTQNKVDYADALGKEPIMLLFATPQFCQSRVCGPVVDVAEQVKQEHEGDAAFIHMEVYENNEPPQIRPQLKAFHLQTEPWLFAIDRKGTVVDVVEGAFGLEEMTRALEKGTGEKSP
jgi:hypothetical protein